MREIASWPEGREFETLPSMTTMTLGAILRAVFGAEGAALDELYDLVPPMAASSGCTWRCLRACGETLVDGASEAVHAVPAPFRRCDRLAYRRCAGRSRMEERSDVLALLVRARYETASR